MKLILNVIGIVIVLAICWLISWDRKSIRWKVIAKALLAEFIIALLIVKIPIGQKIITAMSDGLTAVSACLSFRAWAISSLYPHLSAFYIMSA